jgi:hypothetical protein
MLCGKCKCKSVGRNGMCRYVYYAFEWLCAKNMIDIGRLQHRIRFSDGGLNRLMQHTCPDLMFSHSHLPRTSTLFPTDPPIFKTQSHKVKATSRPPSLSRPAISKSYTHLSCSSSPLILTLTSHHFSSPASLDTDTSIYLPLSPSLFFSLPLHHPSTHSHFQHTFVSTCLDLFRLVSTQLQPTNPTPSSNTMPPKKKTGTATDGAGDENGGVSFSVSFFHTFSRQSR